MLRKLIYNKNSTMLFIAFVMTSIFVNTTETQANSLVYYIGSVIFLSSFFITRAIEQLREK